MKTHDIEIIRISNLKININSPDVIFVTWSKVGYNGEYNKVFNKNQKEFNNKIHLYVFEKSKELYPEYFI